MQSRAVYHSNIVKLFLSIFRSISKMLAGSLKSALHMMVQATSRTWSWTRYFSNYYINNNIYNKMESASQHNICCNYQCSEPRTDCYSLELRAINSLHHHPTNEVSARPSTFQLLMSTISSFILLMLRATLLLWFNQNIDQTPILWYIIIHCSSNNRGNLLAIIGPTSMNSMHSTTALNRRLAVECNLPITVIIINFCPSLSVSPIFAAIICD